MVPRRAGETDRAGNTGNRSRRHGLIRPHRGARSHRGAPDDIRQARDIVAQFARIGAHRGAPVRQLFVPGARDLPDATRSPREILMNAERGVGGGRGGRTRLALLLTLWWVLALPDHSGTRPAGVWAHFIGLDDSTRGARTINANLHELSRRGMITHTPGERGKASTVALLDELGSGRPYRRPDYVSDGLPYFRIPQTLWTTGMIGQLSGPGLAMYLIMLHYQRRTTESADRGQLVISKPTWFTEKSFRTRHGLSEDTRLAGVKDLHDHGVIQIDTVTIDPAGSDRTARHQRRHLTLMPPFEPPSPANRPSLGGGVA
jgi:hypothetical protein